MNTRYETRRNRPFYRGDIYYITDTGATGSEMYADRPAVIVSNNACNKHSPVLEIVYLTSAKKKDLPTHVKIRSAELPSVALCEQIHSVSTSRFGRYVGSCTEYEMRMINRALAVSVGIDR